MDDIKTNTITEPTSDERLLGMLAHLSIFFGGIILPLILWATQKDKSKFVTYNSLLALFFHITYTVLIIMFVMVMAIVIILAGGGFAALESSSNELPAAMIVVIIVFYAGLFAFIIGGIGYGVYLALKTYQGKIVSIPVLGKIIYKKVYGSS